MKSDSAFDAASDVAGFGAGNATWVEVYISALRFRFAFSLCVFALRFRFAFPLVNDCVGNASGVSATIRFSFLYEKEVSVDIGADN